MKRIKDPKKIESKKRMANLAFWVSMCAQNGWTIGQLAEQLKSLAPEEQPDNE